MGEIIGDEGTPKNTMSAKFARTSIVLSHEIQQDCGRAGNKQHEGPGQGRRQEMAGRCLEQRNFVELDPFSSMNIARLRRWPLNLAMTHGCWWHPLDTARNENILTFRCCQLKWMTIHP